MIMIDLVILIRLNFYFLLIFVIFIFLFCHNYLLIHYISYLVIYKYSLNLTITYIVLHSIFVNFVIISIFVYIYDYIISLCKNCFIYILLINLLYFLDCFKGIIFNFRVFYGLFYSFIGFF